jgi:UDP-N-acetyl-D-glucosamine dehydrogenase
MAGANFKHIAPRDFAELVKRNKFFRPHLAASKMDLLEARGAEVAYYDPYVPVIKPTREHSQFAGKKSVAWSRATIEGFDIVLIATNHGSVDYQQLADWAQCIVDTRNAMSGTHVHPGKVWKA